MLSDAQITKFQELYKNRFGDDINEEEAVDRAAQLLDLIQRVYSPITKDEYQQASISKSLNKN